MTHSRTFRKAAKYEWGLPTACRLTAAKTFPAVVKHSAGVNTKSKTKKRITEKNNAT